MRPSLLLAALLFAISPTQGAEPAKENPMPTTETPKYTNRLAKEKSPYLLQHAHNPVDWYPWGGEAFEKARNESKPIFLSVGYSTCHWCHVMEHESFEDPEVAKFMNEHFVNVKVDREERPDVDRVYMTFVQATTGSGGWPMSVWLTPDLKPFVGGTYFPPSGAYGRPGFLDVLKQLATAWRDDREKVLSHSDQIVAELRKIAAAGDSEKAALEKDLVDQAYRHLDRSFDDRLGGFGGAPKFPRPVALNLLMRVYAREGANSKTGKRALEMDLFTLRKMAAGGMHDHLGGGFHRYSVDAEWHVPHFEKMLYDQAQLAVAYIEAFQATHDPLWKSVVRDILDYVRRDMTDKTGGFYSAEDADSLVAPGGRKLEGAFYVWTKKEIEAVIGSDATEVFDRHYGVDSQGNVAPHSDPHGELTGKNVLIQRYTSAETAKVVKKSEADVERILAESRRKLFEARARRPRPHLDDKIITAWNGLMISACARAYQVFADPADLASARRAADFIHTHLYDETKGALIRSYRQGAGDVQGFADDYAFLIQGLLDLYEADFDIARLKWAIALQSKMDELFRDEKNGGYFGISGTDPSILLRMKEDYDGAEPSPSSIAALNLLRLSQMTGNADFRKRAGETLNAFAAQLKNSPTGMPQMLVAFDFHLAKPRQIVIAGPRDAAGTKALLTEVHAHFIPNKVVLLADGAEGQPFLAGRLPFLKTITPIEGKPAAYVCEHYACKLPTTDVATLRRQLAGE